jgi:hypothetical protein
MNNDTVTSEMTYNEKMAFLFSIRKECGLEKETEDNFTDECPHGKYVTEYTFGTM